MVFRNIAAALLNIDTITALYLSKDTLIYEVGPVDTVLEHNPDGTIKIYTQGGPHVCHSEADACKILGLNMADDANAKKPTTKPATKKKTPAATTKAATTKPAEE